MARVCRWSDPSGMSAGSEAGGQESSRCIGSSGKEASGPCTAPLRPYNPPFCGRKAVGCSWARGAQHKVACLADVQASELVGDQQRALGCLYAWLPVIHWASRCRGAQAAGLELSYCTAAGSVLLIGSRHATARLCFDGDVS